ncbi:MAG: hypothetical protein ABIL68_01560 [bacterium]
MLSARLLRAGSPCLPVYLLKAWQAGKYGIRSNGLLPSTEFILILLSGKRTQAEGQAMFFDSLCVLMPADSWR